MPTIVFYNTLLFYITLETVMTIDINRISFLKFYDRVLSLRLNIDRTRVS